MKKLYTLIFASLLVVSPVMADEYIIDKKGMHAFIQFKVSHLGYSWLWGRFNDFEGRFTYDADKPEEVKVEVTINTKSVDSNHAERDKHLRSDDFLNVDAYPEATFVSTSYKENSGKGELKGNFTLNGVTREIVIDVTKIGEGSDPWGGYRVGFEGKTSITMADYNIKKNLGPASKDVELVFSIEGIKQ